MQYFNYGVWFQEKNTFSSTIYFKGKLGEELITNFYTYATASTATHNNNNNNNNNKLRGLSMPTNYTDRAAATCPQS
jgi:uncharacterized protein (DUF1919 family)